VPGGRLVVLLRAAFPAAAGFALWKARRVRRLIRKSHGIVHRRTSTRRVLCMLAALCGRAQAVSGHPRRAEGEVKTGRGRPPISDGLRNHHHPRRQITGISKSVRACYATFGGRPRFLGVTIRELRIDGVLRSCAKDSLGIHRFEFEYQMAAKGNS
jgi:hypothetical protein